MPRSHSQVISANRSFFQQICILATAILQVLATTLPSLGMGEPIGDRSDAAQTLITPAGWAFSIWGPLFAGSIAYAIYQLLPAQKHNPLLATIGWASAGAFLGNALWAVYTQFLGFNFLSAIIIAFTLFCLLTIYRTFSRASAFSRGEQLLVVLPLSALAAWLTAATIVNIAAVLEYHGLDLGNAAPLVSAGVVILGGIIAGAAVWKGRGNPWYALVFLWALAGIFVSSQRDSSAVAVAAVLAALLVLGSTAIRLFRVEDRRQWFSTSGRNSSLRPQQR